MTLNKKQLKLYDRKSIEDMIYKRLSKHEMAVKLDRPDSTILRKIVVFVMNSVICLYLLFAKKEIEILELVMGVIRLSLVNWTSIFT